MMYYLNVEKRGITIAAISTFVLTGILLISGCFIKQKPQKVYKTIQIQLAPSTNTPVVEQLSKKEQQKQAQTAKKAQAKAVKEEKRAQQELKKSVEELAKEQASQTKKQAQWDDSMFAEETPVEKTSGVSPKPTENVPKSSLSGSAGKTVEAPVNTENKTASATATSSQEASSSTVDALNKMSKAQAFFDDDEEDEVYNSSTATTNSGLKINFTSGRSRQILSPMEIILSPESQSKIDSSRTVRITFTIESDGSILMQNVMITPAGILPFDVQTDIKSQVAKWRFSSDPSGEKAVAAFQYTIVVK